MVLQAKERSGYWVEDMELPCFQGVHLTLLLAVGIPGLFVCVALPTCTALLVLANRKRLQHPAVLSRFGFLYDSYRCAPASCSCWPASFAASSDCEQS